MINFRKRNNTDQAYDVGECPISTVQLNNFNADAIVKRIDYQDLIIENSIVYNSTETLTPLGTGVLENDKFLMQHYLPNEYNHIKYLFTDKTSEGNIPLFYQYQLKFDAYGFSNKDIIQVYRNNVELVPQDQYNIEFTYEKTLYDNYYSDNYTSNLDRYGSAVQWGSFDVNNRIHRIKLLLPLSFFDKNSFYTIRYNKHYMNLEFPLHFELLELENLYNTSTDFDLSYSGSINTEIVTIKTESVIKSENLNKLYCVKDPYSQIKEDGLVTYQADGDQDNSSASWNLKIDTGAFVRNESKFHEDTSFYNCEFAGDESERIQVVSYLKPKELGFNVIQIDQSPLYISGYTYPDYNIQLFPNTTDGTTLPSGSIGFNINNELLQDVSISSIDRYKGYILLNKKLSLTNDTSVFAYVDSEYSVFIRNLELNPRISGNYGISSNSEKSFSEIGIAMRKIDGPIVEGTEDEWYHPYFFDFDDPTIFYQSKIVSADQVPTNILTDKSLNWNPYTTDFNPDGEFLPFAVITLNKLSLDIIKITDARRINGGLTDEFIPKLTNNQNNSYSDIGFVDGEILPYEGLKIVHLPSHIYPSLIQRWVNSNQYNSDMYTDITDYEIEKLLDSAGNDAEKEYYTNLLQGKAPNQEDQFRDPFVKMRDDWAQHEASYYIDKVIKRYITAGSQYILLDENFNEIKLRLDI